MTKESMIKVLRYKSEHIKTKIKPEFFSEVADFLEKEQRPKGHWIDHPQGEQCSECGLYVIFRHGDKYCPYCGCRMIEPQESEESE